MAGLTGVLKDPLLSVVMPVYNERTTIDEIIRRVLAVPLRIQLVVVDDWSTDGTGPMLDARGQSQLVEQCFRACARFRHRPRIPRGGGP